MFIFDALSKRLSLLLLGAVSIAALFFFVQAHALKGELEAANAALAVANANINTQNEALTKAAASQQAKAAEVARLVEEAAALRKLAAQRVQKLQAWQPTATNATCPQVEELLDAYDKTIAGSR